MSANGQLNLSKIAPRNRYLNRGTLFCIVTQCQRVQLLVKEMVPNGQDSASQKTLLVISYEDENNCHCQQYDDLDRDAGRADAREHASDRLSNHSEESQCKAHREHVEDETYH
jgi:hypothetical protein